MYNLLKADNDILSATKNNWIEQANDLGDFGVMVADDVTSMLDAIDTDSTGNEHTYFLIKDGETHGRAFLKIMHAAPHRDDSWLKLLKVRLEPNLNLEGKETESDKDASDMFEVLAAVIFESIKLIFNNDIRTIKIYGRTEEMRIMFLALLTDKPLKNLFLDKGLDARKEGAWFVVEKQA